MLKTFSAALIAASVIAAPAFAATTGKTTTQAPVAKTAQTKTEQTQSATGATKPVHHKLVRARHHHKTSALDANAKLATKKPAAKDGAKQVAPTHAKNPG